MSEPVIGTFTGTGESASEVFHLGKFPVSIFGTFVGTVILRRSFDDGVTWRQFGAEITTPTELDPENTRLDLAWSLECTAFTSGTIGYEFGAA